MGKGAAMSQMESARSLMLDILARWHLPNGGLDKCDARDVQKIALRILALAPNSEVYLAAQRLIAAEKTP